MAIPSSADQVKKVSNKKYPKPVYLFIGFVLISFSTAFILGGIVIGRDKAEKQSEETSLPQQVKVNASQIPENPDNWQIYKLSSAGIEVKLPEKLTKLGEWKESVKPGEKGTLICFSNENNQESICSGKTLVIGGSSTDYSQRRGAQFTDLQGFTKANGKYFIRTVGGDKFELKDAKFKEFENENGLEIIKVLGENTDGLPKPGTPGEEYLGALVNTKNSEYPGLSVQMKINSDLSEYEFDQILRSIKVIN